MKNITISVDEATYRRARILAAEQDTSVSALVKQFLAALARNDPPDFAKLAQEERELRERVQAFRAADRVARDELHDRAG